MQVLRSIPIVVEDDPDLRATLQAFTAVKNLASPYAFNEGKPVLNAIRLQRACYDQIKGRVNATMTQCVCRLVAGAYGAAKKNKHRVTEAFRFKAVGALFLIGTRGRDASFIKDKLSIWTTAGRKQLAYRIPRDFQSQFDQAVELNSLSVFLRNGRLQARLTLTLDCPTPIGYKPVGVDLNETNAVVAVDSDGRTFFATGKKIKERNQRTRKTRKRLVAKLHSRKAQKRGTRSVRRSLKRLSGKQINRSRTFAHTVAKQLCSWAPPGSVLVFEDLKGIGKTVSKKSKQWKTAPLRRRLTSWNYAAIRAYAEQKAPVFGHEVGTVDPSFTSQTCNECGSLGSRNRHRFSCACGNRAHADVNAAKNIRDKFVVLRYDGLSGSAYGASTLSTSPDTSVSLPQAPLGAKRSEARSGRRKTTSVSGKPLALC